MGTGAASTIRVPTPVEPLGTGELMPAILVGFVQLPWHEDRWKGLTSDCPRYIVEVLQQAGGMAMSYPEAVGILMRLAANPEHALQEPSHLIRGFHFMAEDPRYGILRRDYPKLAPLCGTWGADYSSEELRQLDSALSPYFRLPGATRGLEAFVELEHADPLSFFGGWRVVEVSAGVEQIENVEQLKYGDLWSDGSRLTGAMLDELLDLGRQIGIDGPLTAVLLWENAD